MSGVEREAGAASGAESDLAVEWLLAKIDRAIAGNYFTEFGPIQLAGVRDHITALTQTNADLLAALQGVVRVADRNTDEFNAARAAIARATGERK